MTVHEPAGKTSPGRVIKRSWVGARLLGFAADVPVLPASSAIVSRLSVYATLIIAARLLSADEFGVFTVFLALLGVFSALVTGGGDMWLNRLTFGRLSAGGQAPRLWLSYLIVVAAISTGLIAASLTFNLVTPGLASFHVIILITVLASATMGLTEAVLAILRAGGGVRFFFVVRDIVLPLMLLGLIAWIRPETAVSILYIYLVLWAAAFSVVSASLIYRAPAILPAAWPRRTAWYPLAIHTFGLIYSNLTSRLSVYIDIFVLASFISLSQIGEYRVAAQFAIGFMVVQHFIFLSLPWQMRQSATHASMQDGLESVGERQRSLIVLATLSVIGFWLLAEPLLALFGERFIDIVDVLRILLLVRFATLLWGPQHEFLISSGHSIKDAHANIVALVTWLVAFFLLVRVLDPVRSAILGNILAMLGSHLVRHWILVWHGVPRAFGHPFGIGLPLVVYAAAAALTFAALRL